MSLQKSFEIVETSPSGDDLAQNSVAQSSIALTYDQRLLRRKKLTMESGEGFYVDLPKTVSVRAGQGFLLQDGRVVAIKAAEEDLFSITGPDMLRYAWHIGNRHTPCELTADQLVIQRDPVIKAMLEQLGAEVRDICTAFTPEGGAYGHGRTMGHSHGHDGSHDHGRHDHGHDHGHDHDHSDAQDHGHRHHE